MAAHFVSIVAPPPRRSSPNCPEVGEYHVWNARLPGSVATMRLSANVGSGSSGDGCTYVNMKWNEPTLLSHRILHVSLRRVPSATIRSMARTLSRIRIPPTQDRLLPKKSMHSFFPDITGVSRCSKRRRVEFFFFDPGTSLSIMIVSVGVLRRDLKSTLYW